MSPVTRNGHWIPDDTWRGRHPGLAGAFWVWVAAFGAGIVGVMAGILGAKGVVLAAAAFAFLAVLLIVTKREEIILAVAVLSIFALFHKSFGAQHPDISGGPISVYVSSFDIMVFVLWFTWWVRGPREMAQQLHAAFRRPVMWAPIVAFAFILPSLLSAPVTGLAIAEIVRMLVAISVFVYFAVRIRTKTQVWIVLGALGAALSVEAVIVAGQYVTHSALGMSAFGTPTKLNNRFDGYDALRPFGTIVHPVFLGAFVGPCALMAYSLAANLRATRRRLLCLAVAVLGVTPIFFANARSAAFGFTVAFLSLTIAFIVTGRLTPRVVKTSLAVLAVLLVVLFPLISGFVNRSLGNRTGGQATRTATCTRAVDAATACSHFSFEWRARMQLNHVGLKIWEQKPVAGSGLNNFEQVMDRYDTYGLIFDAPAHNLYILQLAESGILGLIGLFVLAVPLFLVAVRLARSKDRLLSAVGFGVTGAFVFWGAEEMLEFSLRQEQPRALFFTFAGLAVACSRLAGLDRPRPVLRTRRLQPPPPTNGDRPVVVRTDNENGNGTRTRAGRRTRHALSRVRTSGVGAGRRGSARMRHTFTRSQQTRAERLARSRRRRRGAVSATLAGILLAGGSVGLAAGSAVAASPSVDGLKIVFAAFDRVSHQRGIYTVDSNGANLRKVSPDDGRDYSWPTFAYNGQSIVFTARSAGQAEPIYLMNVDGSNLRPITANPWRNAQPKIAADGRSMIFTSFWNEYQKVALYRMDFATGAVTNLSALASQSGAFDSDPAQAADGRIVFVDARAPRNGANRPGQVAIMSSAGTDRRLVTDDGFYNTDPQPSPDLQAVAIARYVGEGDPHDPNSTNPFQTKLRDFVLVNHNLTTGAEQQLTQGQACYTRPDSTPCAPEQGPAYVPQWTPDGNAVGYMSVLSADRTCICVVNRDGSSPKVVIESTNLAINWFSWIRPTAAPAQAILDPKPQGQLTPVRMVVSGTNASGREFLVETTPDRFGGQLLPVPDSLGPESAKLSNDRSQVWFDARSAFDPDSIQYGPAPPAGVGRTRHYTLGFLNQYYTDPPILRANAASRQLYSLGLSPPPKIEQKTTVGTEDYRDAIPDGEARGNALPAVSPDGRYVIFTNISIVNNESFILRYDRKTGAVLNLTNATAGAVAVADSQAAWSPDSKKIAFASNELDGMQIWVMDADGYNAHKITDDDNLNMMPTFSPDGRYVVYASYRGQSVGSTGNDDLARAAVKGTLDLEHWVLVRVDLATGEQKILVQSNQSPMLRPVYDPDGSKIYYIGISGPPLQSDIFVVDANGGVGRPLQVTTETFETAVDIK